MSEPVFLRDTRGLTLDEIVALTGAVASKPLKYARRITDVAPLDRASPRDICFYDNKRFSDDALRTHAGVCLTTEALAKDLPAHVTALVMAKPYPAFVRVMRALFPQSLRPSSLSPAGATVGAHIDPSARLESNVTVEPGAVIGPRAEVGSGTIIGASAVIGSDVRIGRDCSIGATVVVTNTLVGDRVILHPGCKIGQDGFGFVMDGGGHLKVPQIGRVVIQDDVEIGAGTTIDRGAIRDTVIGEGSKIDNLVQVGHNVSIGRHCVVVAKCGIAGSAVLEDFVVLGASVGVNNNAYIGEGAQIAACGNVNGAVPPGARWGGTPAKPVKQWFRELTTLERLARQEPGRPPADE
ncbi:MAG TPA: UDP-3-O-(3-hydroxymyristoyl)glucosamine N-acyltransferase [Pseudolabrys sp.]|nr:UDP-3-O-(3-hydroxymyristoyl)glucosamine N-acyltransferase [Pseudolabrys sp.]